MSSAHVRFEAIRIPLYEQRCISLASRAVTGDNDNQIDNLQVEGQTQVIIRNVDSMTTTKPMKEVNQSLRKRPLRKKLDDHPTDQEQLHNRQPVRETGQLAMCHKVYYRTNIIESTDTTACSSPANPNQHRSEN